MRSETVAFDLSGAFIAVDMLFVSKPALTATLWLIIYHGRESRLLTRYRLQDFNTLRVRVASGWCSDASDYVCRIHAYMKKGRPIDPLGVFLVSAASSGYICIDRSTFNPKWKEVTTCFKFKITHPTTLYCAICGC
jgi:hypothetical protein